MIDNSSAFLGLGLGLITSVGTPPPSEIRNKGQKYKIGRNYFFEPIHRGGFHDSYPIFHSYFRADPRGEFMIGTQRGSGVEQNRTAPR